MTAGRWIIWCALPCTKCLYFDSKNTFRSILTLAAFRDELKNSLSKVIIAMASAGLIMRTKGSEDRYSKQANKVPSIMLVYRQKCRDSVLQYIKDA